VYCAIKKNIREQLYYTPPEKLFFHPFLVGVMTTVPGAGAYHEKDSSGDAVFRVCCRA
jgi:hypothetical protein